MSMKKLLVIIVFIFSSSVAVAAYEKKVDIKFNPEIDFSQLSFATVSVFYFDKIALCGDDVMNSLHIELKKLLSENGIYSELIYPQKNLDEKDDFSLSATGDKDKKTLFRASPNDIIISGSLLRADQMKKKWGKTYVDMSLELYIYSKSLDKVMYKASFSYMMPGAYHWGGKMREAFSDLLTPFFEKTKKSG